VSETTLHIFLLAIEPGVLNQVFHQHLLLFLSVLHLEEVLILVVKPENGKAKSWLVREIPKLFQNSSGK
jgi:hypothetical protein